MQDRAKRTMFYHDLGKGTMAQLAKLSNNSEFNIKNRVSKIKLIRKTLSQTKTIGMFTIESKTNIR